MKYPLIPFLALTVVLTTGTALAGDEPKSGADTGVVIPPPRQFAPMTRSERVAYFASHLADPESVLRAASSAGFKQGSNSPKEWGGGAEAYGERFGSAFAQHIIQNSLMFGSSFALHED